MASPRRPFALLTEDEIARAVAVLRSSAPLPPAAFDHVRFSEISLAEPPKAAVLAGGPVDRRVRIVFFSMAAGADHPRGAVFRAFVSVFDDALVEFEQLHGVQPLIHADEFREFEAVCRTDPRLIEAMKKRGVEDMNMVCLDPWSAGWYGDEEDETGRRLCRGLLNLRLSPDDNIYAHPIENVAVIFDLSEMRVFDVKDHGVVPIPMEPRNFDEKFISKEAGGPGFREGLKPLEIIQPEGPSFEVRDGNQVEWQKWSFQVGFNAREGLVLHRIGYLDGGEVRPILYRASIAEMVVPYGDPHPIHSRKNAFDFGEYAAGAFANSLELGCDCKGHIHYFDAVVADSRGKPLTIRNAICMHEEDYGLLWKHTDFRAGGRVQSRRSRRLVISFITTVGNYDYGFFWYFYQDGTIQHEVKLTGIVSTAAVPLPKEGEDPISPEYGSLLAPGVAGVIHQHFFIARLDFDIDGTDNNVDEISSFPASKVPGSGPNPRGNAFRSVATRLRSELEARRVCEPLEARVWRVSSATRRNAVGQPTAYRVVPGENVLPMWEDGSPISRRAAFASRHLWVTAHADGELYGAGEFPNQSRDDAGVRAYGAADRGLEATDVVVWYNFGHHHVVRPEDFPVMPVAYVGFSLKPAGFFDCNPALDVPPEPKTNRSVCCLPPHRGVAGTQEKVGDGSVSTVARKCGQALEE